MRKERPTFLKSSRKGQGSGRACRASAVTTLSVFVSLRLHQSPQPWEYELSAGHSEGAPRFKGNSLSCLTWSGCECPLSSSVYVLVCPKSLRERRCTPLGPLGDSRGVRCGECGLPAALRKELFARMVMCICSVFWQYCPTPMVGACVLQSSCPRGANEAAR